MSNRAINRARKIQGLNPAAKLIAVLLADSKNETTGQCFPSIPTLVADSCLSESGVKLAIRELERLGLVRREFIQKKNRTEYHLLFDDGSYSVTPEPGLLSDGGGLASDGGGSLSDGGGLVSNPKPEVTRKENQKNTSAKADRDEFFEIFWQEMPKRRTASKKEALAAWRKYLKPEDWMVCAKAAMAFFEEKEAEAAKRKCSIDDLALLHPCRFISQEVWRNYTDQEEAA